MVLRSSQSRHSASRLPPLWEIPHLEEPFQAICPRAGSPQFGVPSFGAGSPAAGKLLEALGEFDENEHTSIEQVEQTLRAKYGTGAYGPKVPITNSSTETDGKAAIGKELLREALSQSASDAAHMQKHDICLNATAPSTRANSKDSAGSSNASRRSLLLCAISTARHLGNYIATIRSSEQREQRQPTTVEDLIRMHDDRVIARSMSGAAWSM
eukprot:gnl/TRDRNA2_/TRDRNA2_177367_c4_seq10.p1 gnl/TRDRNA2_/TRDRNA2_177367_c4~~gnl/TRDRNA2_/TRDRNA2_177367_c4_seq10.p1  ORF type:complete len:212 (+),score=21.39 gnl/TRDRNA2_/TRDRNA2_177367_c4_seq10:92-727(+)